MIDEFTEAMHSSLFITKSEEISQRVYCVILDLEDGVPLATSLLDYNVTKEQFDKYKSDWS